MRYNPSRQVLGGALGTVDLTNDAFDIKFTDATTNMAGNFTIQLDDRMGRYSLSKYTTLGKFQPVKISLDGTLVFKGRMDDPYDAIIGKKNAMVYEIKGKSDFSVLTNTVCSKHVVQESAQDIVNEIIALQNSLALSQDPKLTIPTGANRAPDTPLFNFLWKRKSLQEMLYDLSCKLGAPVSQGGTDQFYDFWSTPADEFYYVPAGSVPSGGWVNLGFPGGIEQVERHYIIDPSTIKNDIWTWAQNTATGAALGRIPLTMQPGYAKYPLDSWTEGNAADYKTSDSTVTVTNDTDNANAAVGNASIFITVTEPPVEYIPYWSMPMPFGTSPVKWAGQPPNNVMNTYNETGVLSETDGQMSALLFQVKTLVLDVDLQVRVVDYYSNTADTPIKTYSNKQSDAKYASMFFPFGPDSNYVLTNGTFFDWASVSEIRFMMPTLSQQIGVWFDGFMICKSLVVNTFQSGATSRRTYTQSISGILTYPDAVNYGQATLESMMQPQQYYEIKNIGRNDIPAGYAFISENKTLVARTVDYTFNKKDGWIIDLKGWEAT